MKLETNSCWERFRITKADLVEKVYLKLDCTKDDAYYIIEQVLKVIKECLVAEELVKITGFGNFQVKHKNAIRGRDSQTGRQLTISARKILTFTLFQNATVICHMMIAPAIGQCRRRLRMRSHQCRKGEAAPNAARIWLSVSSRVDPSSVSFFVGVFPVKKSSRWSRRLARANKLQLADE
jgi:integration host factor subunit alpha